MKPETTSNPTQVTSHPLVIHQSDPRLVAIKAEILHGMPELTGKQINTAAMLAVMVIARMSKENQT